MVSVSEFFKHKIKSEQQADFQIPVNFELLEFFYFSPFLIFSVFVFLWYTIVSCKIYVYTCSRYYSVFYVYFSSSSRTDAILSIRTKTDGTRWETSTWVVILLFVLSFSPLQV